MHESLKLSDFLELIKSTIEMGFGYEGFWVMAELSEWRKSGKHYYGELIEHNGLSKYPIAKIRCNCWANKIDYIQNKFSITTGENLKVDMKVLLKVSVSYHVSFGLSLNIIDIDPAFTLGDRQARKIEILETLSKKDILDKNKNLSMPKDFTSIAVITSLTAAGKGDFFEEADKIQKLGLCKFDIYEAKMQGLECARSVAEAFDKIRIKSRNYDAVVLIRGGGSQADLDWFNNIVLAQNICNSEIPVMIGIGHERDSTVLDEICTKRFDTPSKVINYIINTIIDKAKAAEYNYGSIVKVTKNIAKQSQSQLDNIYTSFSDRTENYLHQTNQNIEHFYKNILSVTRRMSRLYTKSIDMQYDSVILNSQNLIRQYYHSIDEAYEQSRSIAKSTIKYYTHTSEYLYKQILSISIRPTLKRGFSITRLENGRYITSKNQAQACENLEIIYVDGQIQVEVKRSGDTK